MQCQILASLLAVPALITTATILPAAAIASGPEREPPEAIVLAARGEVASLAQADISTTRIAGGFAPDRLQLPRCISSLTARSRAPTFQARHSVEVLCSQPQWRVFVPIMLEAHRRVVVLKRALPAGTVLSEEDLTYSDAVTGTVAKGTFVSAKDIIGARLLRSAGGGQPVVAGWIRRMAAVRKGQAVSVVGRSAALTIRTRGVASADASLAERVRVRNPATGREIEGTVSGIDSVEISLD